MSAMERDYKELIDRYLALQQDNAALLAALQQAREALKLVDEWTGTSVTLPQEATDEVAIALAAIDAVLEAK